MEQTKWIDTLSRPALRLGELSAIALVLGGFLSVSGASHAAWEVLPSFSVESTAQDNVRLRPEDKEDGFFHSGTVQARIANRTEVIDTSAIIGGTVSRISGVDTIAKKTRATMYSQLSSRRRFERATIGLNGSFRRDDLFRSLEIIDLPDGPDQPPDPDGGSLIPEPGVDDELLTDADPDVNSITVQVLRNQLRVGPMVNYTIDSRTSVNLGYNFAERTYDNDEGLSGLQDSRTHSVGLGLRRELSPVQSGTVRVAYSRNQPDEGIDTNVATATIGWTADLSEITRVELNVGGRRLDNDLGNAWGTVGSARIDRRLYNGSVFALVERSVIPSGFGVMVENDRVELGVKGRFTRRLRWSVTAQAFSTDNSQPGARGNQQTQDFFRVRPRIRWQATETVSISGAYTYTWVDRERFEGTASRNALTVALAYSPQRRL
jgi:hypothetical protein